MASESTYLSVGRALVKAAHGKESPLVVDPFAGGGSIPLEALRLGCETFASDLNPVACLILKAMLEDIPRYGSGLAEELRQVGSKIKQHIERSLADIYPLDPDGSTPIAYLWARTVRCESPNCGAEIPLMRTFWLCKKPKRKWALRPLIKRPSGTLPQVTFEVFEPKADKEVKSGTVVRAKATCICCNTVLPPERVRTQLATQRGGADVVFNDTGYRIDGARMIAVVTLKPRQTGRHYRLPTDADYEAVYTAQQRLIQILDEWKRTGQHGLCPIPNEPTPSGGGSGAGRAFSVQRYGMLQWGDLFTARQKVVLIELGKAIRTIANERIQDIVAFGASKQSDFNSSLSRWANHMEKSVATFGRQALPILWDWGEVAPMADASGSFNVAMEWIANAAETIAAFVGNTGQVQLIDATQHRLPDQSADIWFTDPPYYDAVPYADLSDYFLVWLKRTLPGHPLLRDPIDPDNPLSPKIPEAVQDETKYYEGQPKNREWFEETMARSFAEGHRVLSEDGIAAVVFAHKTTEGWEALLSGMIRGGYTITASWPIATEKPDRMRAMDSAALATSIHLICRPRPENAQIGDWADVLRELPLRVSAWMERLQIEGIRGADLVFACIGPALEVFSRYQAVETAEGRTVDLSEYLEKVWEVVGRTALQQILGTVETQASRALEEDARLTALFLWTLQSTETSQENNPENEETTIKSTKSFILPFDVVRRFAQPMGIDLDIWTHRIIDQTKGVVRLLPVTERARDLFGDNGASAAADWIESDPNVGLQIALFPELNTATLKTRRHRGGRKAILDEDIETLQPINATTLDRVHVAMLLQVNGHANALRTLISIEQERGPEFLQLANALSALYPRNSQEKRLLDAMLLTVPR